MNKLAGNPTDHWTFNRKSWALSRGRTEEARALSKGKVRRKSRFWSGVQTLVKGMENNALLIRGKQNASNPRLVQRTITCESLPAAFDGYRILHLTDLHLDFNPDLVDRICRVVSQLTPDLCVMTGDYITWFNPQNWKVVISGLKQVVSSVSAPDGIFGILGNHDSWQMVAPLEAIGIRMLINESRVVIRDDRQMLISGVDDPHIYYTPEIPDALKTAGYDFKLALVHTPEMFKTAADNHYDLYLAGHTHGGQICLPGGLPLIVNLKRGHRFFRGQWQYNGMKGYTGQGVGVVGLKLRYNTISEMTMIRLSSGDGRPR